MTSEIFKLLDGLTKDLGVQRSNLYELLDHRLRTVWGITKNEDEDNPELVREIVQWQLERLINLPGRSELDVRDQAIARMSFNIGYAELAGKKLQQRQEWFSKQPSPHARNAETTRKRIKLIIRKFAKHLETEEQNGTLPERDDIAADIRRRKLTANLPVLIHTESAAEPLAAANHGPLVLQAVATPPRPPMPLLRPDPNIASILQDLATKVRQRLEANEFQRQVHDDFAIPIRWVNAPPELASSDLAGLDLSGSLDRIEEIIVSPLAVFPTAEVK